ncbi:MULTISPECIES: hypothetical protein [unclassified Streptomyces]|uniref:hypothetical protein n=1 Tax=unclassified Streptomyces TaxID=2593676 RepID=UPI0036EC7BA8
MSRRFGRNENGHEREHRIDRTGNGTVNDGPESASHATADARPEAISDSGRDALSGSGRDALSDSGRDALSGSGRDALSGSGRDALSDTDRDAFSDSDRDAFSGPDQGPGPGSRRGPGPGGGGGPEDLADMDEAMLRRMLHGAVQHIGPSEGTLDHLHRAVPARRVMRRQAVVGMAAAALLIGTAVPAFVHVANSDGSNTAHAEIAGHGEQAQGGSGTESGAESGGAGNVGTDGQASAGQNQPTSTSSPDDSPGEGADGSLAGGAADPAASAVASLPACGSEQLGVASARTGAAGADGTVYGTFRIANVSGTVCAVSSSGSVGFQAMGAADPARIAVVQHTAGDPAAGLPDPSQDQGTVLLKPSMSYEVKFAWVPKDTCPTAGGSPSPTPTGGPEGASGTAAGGTGNSDGNSDTDAQLGSEDGGGTLSGSVAVTHTPEAGSPVAETKIVNACSGTIYRTGVLTPTT